MHPVRRPTAPYATHVVPAASWSNLAVAESTLQSLHELGQRATDAPDGVAALFTGGSRHTKAIAAEALAGTLGADLFKVDLSAVLSKWIGETEKNLRRVFAVAEMTESVLLLDEADALFGTRTEVADAHDRYARQVVDYLLGEMRTFPGVVILATRAVEGPDLDAMRRIAAEVRFHRRPRPTSAS